MRNTIYYLLFSLLFLLPTWALAQVSGHGAAAAYITTSSEPWGQTSNISALNAVYGSTGWNKYIYGSDANGNVSNIFSSTRSLVFIEGGNSNTTAMKNFLDANWSTINTWISGGRTLIVNAATNESIGKFQIGSSGVYSERILTNNMVAYSNSSTYPSTTSNVHPLLRTNVTINGVTGDAYYSGNYYGNYVAHNVITGIGLNSIFTVSGQTSQYTLAEKTIGQGRMLVGGLTLPWFITVASWQPQPQMTRFMYAMLGWVQAVSNPAPSISTVAFSNLTSTSVTVGGNSINANGETITAKGVAYSTSQNPTISNSKVSGGTGTANFSVSITGLSPNTTYYARAYATSPTGTGYGNQISFRTLPVNPTNATTSASNNTICSSTYTNLSVSNAQSTVYWYTNSNRSGFVGTGNPRSVNPSVTTTYYAWNYNGNFSNNYTSVTVTVNQPASQPASASVSVPATADGLTEANLSWAQSTGDGTIQYYWAVGPTSTVTYEAGSTDKGIVTNPTLTAIAEGLTKSTAYYLAVKATNNCGTSTYRRSAIFYTNNERIYVAGANGTVGTTIAGGQASITEITAHNANGSNIYAVPNTGYNFVNWSDGSTDNPRQDLSVTTSATITANFAANRLAFVSQPTTSRAGETIASFQVRFTDTYGNTMSDYNEPITIAISNNPSISQAGVLSGTTTVTAVSGVATFNNLSINKTGLSYTLVASAASPVVTTPVSNSFDIIPAANVNYFTVAGIADPHDAGETTSPTVTAYDAFDNVKYDYTGTITFSTDNVSLDGSKPTTLPANYTFLSGDLGVKTFANGVNLKQYGETPGYYVKVNDVDITAAEGQQSNISVNSADLNYYTIKANSNYATHPADNNVLVGTPFSITAYLYDEFDNLKEDFTGPLEVTFTTNAVPSPLGNTPVIVSTGNQTFTAGIATIPGFTLYNAQETPTISITETLTGSTGTTPAITVWPEALDNFELVEVDGNENPVVYNIGGTRVTAGSPFSVRATARDQYNNIKRDYLGFINFKSSNDAIVQDPTGLQQFQANNGGIRIFQNAVSIPKVGNYWLRVADSPDAFKVGELQNIVVRPGDQDADKSELYFTQYPSLTASSTNPTVYTYPTSPDVIAGDFISVTIIPRDNPENLLCDCQSVVVKLNGVDEHRNGTPVNGVPSLITIPVTDNHDGTYTASIRVTDMSQINTITAVVGGTTLSTQLKVEVTKPDEPSLVVSTLTATANSITTDENTLLTLQLKDQFANPRLTDDGTMTFNTTLGGFGANNGNNSVTATYSVGTPGAYTATLYASYHDENHGVGNATITASADFTDANFTDGNFTDNEIVAITEGLPSLDQSTITADPTTMTTDGTSTISIQLEDHLGNKIQNDRGSLTLATTLGTLSSVTNNTNGSYTATLSGAYNASNNGVGTATITGNFTGTGTASSVTGALTDFATVTITEGLPDLTDIEITVADAAITADETTLVTVQLKDQFGNLIVNDRGTVTLSVSPIGVIANGTTTGNTEIEANYVSDGSYTATFLLNAIGVGTATITGKFDGNAITDNAEVEVTHGVATHLAFDTEPALIGNTIAGVEFNAQPVVSVRDQFGNLVNTGAASSAAITATAIAPASASLQGTTSLSVVAGSATFTNLSYNKAEDIKIEFASSSLELESSTITVVHNIPNYLTITAAATVPSTDGNGNYVLTAGVAQNITLSVYDAYNNLATRFDGNKSITFSGAANSPAPPYTPTVNGVDFGQSTTLNFTDGQVTTALILYKEEITNIAANYTNGSFNDGTVSGSVNINAANTNRLPVNVSQAVPAYFHITIAGGLTQVTAGTSHTITVKAFDQYNNPATNYSGTKSLVFSGAGVSPVPSTSPTIDGTAFGTATDLTFDNTGTATATMVLYKAETGISVTVAESGDNPVQTGGEAYDLDLDVVHGSANYFAVTGTGTMTAGGSQTITVTAYDTWNNLATGYVGDKEVIFTGANVSPLTPAPFSGSAFGYSPRVTNKNGAYIEFGTNTTMTFTSGAATGTMVLYKEEDVNIEAEVGAITTPVITNYDYRLAVSVDHATPDFFAVTGTTQTMTAGGTQTITVKLYDQYNNIATTYDGDKNLTFSGANPSELLNNPKMTSTTTDIDFGSTTVWNFTDGEASGTMTLYKAESAAIRVSNGTQTTSNDFDWDVSVSPNVAHNLAITTQPAHSTTQAIAGVVFSTQPVVRVRDVYGNLVASDNSTVITAARGATGTADLFSTGDLTATASGGIATFSGLNYQKAENMNILFSSGSLQTVTSNTLTVVHNVPTYMAITGTATQTAGTSQTITVTAYDAYDNVATRFAGSKDIIFSGANSSPAPAYTPTIAGIDLGTTTSLICTSGVATATMVLYKEESVNIAASHSSSFEDPSYTGTTAINIAAAYVDATTDNRLAVTVSQADAAYLAITGAATQTAGQSQNITITAYDAFNNKATNYTGGNLTFTGAWPSDGTPSINPTVDGTNLGSPTNLTFSNGEVTKALILYRTDIVDLQVSDGTIDSRYTHATDYNYGLEVTVSNASAALLATYRSQQLTSPVREYADHTNMPAGETTLTINDKFFNVPAAAGTRMLYRDIRTNTYHLTSVYPFSSSEPQKSSVSELFSGGGTLTAGHANFPSANLSVTSYDPVSNTIVYNGVTYEALPYAVWNSEKLVAGADAPIGIKAFDQYNNPALDYTGTKSLTFSYTGHPQNHPFYYVEPNVNGTDFGTATSVGFNNGVTSNASTLHLYTARNESVTVSDGNIGSSITLNSVPYNYPLTATVEHASPNRLSVRFATSSSPVTAGVAHDIVVTAYDAYNNLATGFTGAKQIRFSGANASPSPATDPTVAGTNFGSNTPLIFSSGTVTASMILYKAESGLFITAADWTAASQGIASSNITFDSQPYEYRLAVDVDHNTATKLAIDTEPSTYVRAGDALATQPVISIRDAYGNVITSDNATTITASANGTQELLGTRELTASSGVVNYAGLNYTLMENITISFTSNPALTTVTSNSITVDHNRTAKFDFTTKPNFIIAGGQRGAYVVTRYDAYDNLVNNVVKLDGTDDSTPETVYLYTDGSVTNPFVSTFHDAATAGNTITSINIADNATTANFWYYSTNAGDHLITGSDASTLDNPDAGVTNAVHNTLEVRPAALSYFNVYNVGGTADQNGWTEHYYGDSQTVIVEAIDILGNRKTNYTGTITFNLTDALAVVGTNYPADYTFTVGVNGDNGIHTFTDGILFTRPSFEHPDYPNVNEWWVTAVDQAQPAKYGSQVKIKVLARPITITADAQTKQYYGDTYDLGTSYFTVTSGISPTADIYAGSESVTSVTLTSTGTATTALAGTHDIVPSNATGINGFNPDYYSITYTNGTLTVEERPITITVTSGQDKVYSTADPVFAYTLSSGSLVNGDTFAGALARATGEDVANNYAISQGTLTIENGGTNKAANYSITFVGANFEITPWPLVFSNFNASDKTYDATTTASLTFSDNRPIGGDNLTFNTTATFADKNVNWTNSAAGTKSVSYTISISGGNDANNYIISSANPNTSGNTTSWTGSTIATITRRPINVTAVAVSRIYDGTTDSYDNTTGPVNPSVQTAQLVGTDAVSDEGVQTYASKNVGTNIGLTPSATVINDGNNGDNYDITYVSENLGTITERDITVAVTGNPTKVYDGNTTATLASADYTISNLVTGESMTITETVGTYNSKNVGTSPNRTVSVSLDAGDYTAGANTLLNNYTLANSATGDATITQRSIAFSNFSVDNKTYDGTTTVSNASFSDNRVAGDVLTFTYDVSFNDKHAGTAKPVTFSNIVLGGTDAGNYNIVSAGGTTTADIAKRALTVTVDANQSKTYGDLDPASYTYTVTGLNPIYGSGDMVVGAVDARVSGETVGTYAIQRGTWKIEDASNADMESNYDITFTPANFTINKLPVTITADAKEKFYGETDPSLTFVSSPAVGSSLANGLTISFTGALDRNSGANVGNYAINQNTVDNSNYQITYNTDNLTIKQRPITLIATNQTKTYGFGPSVGNQHPDFWELGTALYTVDANNGMGMVGSETITYALLTSAGEARDAHVGTYDINFTADTETGTNGFDRTNYAISYTAGTLTILTRELNLSNFAADNKVYDGTNVATGLGFDDNRVPGDNLAFTRTAVFTDVNAGSNKVVEYSAISISGGSDQENYHLESSTTHWKTDANRTITQAPLTITANNVEKPAGSTLTNVIGSTEFTISGLQNGETATSVDIAYGNGALAAAASGTYSSQVVASNLSGGTFNMSNYNPSYVNGDIIVYDQLSGYVYYYQQFSFVNQNGTWVGQREDEPIQGATVSFYDGNDDLIATSTADATGKYTFNSNLGSQNIAKIQVNTNLPWGGVSANDALAMQLKSVNNAPAYWQTDVNLPFNVPYLNRVGNVDGTTSGGNPNITVIDVLNAKFRILNPTNTFTVGDWIYYGSLGANNWALTRLPASNNTAYISGQTLVGNNLSLPNFYARAAGDMDGDYVFNLAKTYTPLQQGEVVTVPENEWFDWDVSLKNSLEFAAMSMNLTYDDTKVEIQSISSTLEGFDYILDGNQIRVVWSELLTANRYAGEALFTLKARTIAPVNGLDDVLFVDDNYVFGNAFAEFIPGVEIVATRIANQALSLGEFDESLLSLDAYPNPFRDVVNISYDLPSNAHVAISLVDLLGVEVAALGSQDRAYGSYLINFQASEYNLQSGIYFVRMYVTVDGKTYTKQHKLVYIH